MSANRRMMRKPSQTAVSFSQSLSPDLFKKMPLMRDSAQAYAGGQRNRMPPTAEETVESSTLAEEPPI
eukprot:2052414-Amphidinium_carterae.1